MANDDFDRLTPAEAEELALDLWRSEIDILEDRIRATAAGFHFCGREICWEDGSDFEGIFFSAEALGWDRDLDLDAAQAAALFLLLNRSRVNLRQIDDAEPPGIYCYSMHPWVQPGDWNVVAIYTTPDSQGVFLSSLIEHIFYREDDDVPDRLGTAGFVLLAIAAYRLGFRKVSLLAGGGVPKFKADWDIQGMIGYHVWPKFGFDAPVRAEEVADVPELADCRTVQAVVARDPIWWKNEGGNGRVMEFDLTPCSASWSVLINYVKNWLDVEEEA